MYKHFNGFRIIFKVILIVGIPLSILYVLIIFVSIFRSSQAHWIVEDKCHFDGNRRYEVYVESGFSGGVAGVGGWYRSSIYVKSEDKSSLFFSARNAYSDVFNIECKNDYIAVELKKSCRYYDV